MGKGSEETTAYIALGSNQAPKNTCREELLGAATTLVEGFVGTVAKSSSLYETTAMGGPAPDYLNQVLRVKTVLSPQALLMACLHIERLLGRRRRKKWAPRAIDLDILYYGTAHIRSAPLHIPHPHLAERRFVLTPMAEIAPHLLHPVLKKTQRELLRELPEKGQDVWKWAERNARKNHPL